MNTSGHSQLVLQPFRALRPAVTPDRLARLLCPPYDMIDEPERTDLLRRDCDNAVAYVLPEPSQPTADGRTRSSAVPDPDRPDDRYVNAATILTRQVANGLLRVDPNPALYVYEIVTSSGARTRGLLGGIELRDPADRIILPHENTMAGPIADRLALMDSTQANLEPIYLVYDGGGYAADVVAGIDTASPIALTQTDDEITHRLWAITDPERLRLVAADLAPRQATIADGHHRYATYRALQQQTRAEHGSGPWDYGLSWLVDSTAYGPQVAAIHRVISGLPVTEAAAAIAPLVSCDAAPDPATALAHAEQLSGFTAVLTDGKTTYLVHADPDGTDRLVDRARRPAEPGRLAELDVTILHRVIIEQIWQLPDSLETVRYEHNVSAAIGAARQSGGTAVLLQPTPVTAVTAIAAAGALLPRKSTLFTPKPATGLAVRRFQDQN